MEDNRQVRGPILSWLLIGVAFLTIIFIILIRFVGDGRKAAKLQSRDKLCVYTSSWTGELNAELSAALKEAEMLSYEITSNNLEYNDDYVKGLAQIIIDGTCVSHVMFFDKNGFVCDNKGLDDFEKAFGDFSFDPEAPVNTVTYEYDGVKNTAFAAYTELGDGGFIVCTINYSDVMRLFKLSGFEDASFLVAINKDGMIQGTFEKYSDIDSMFLRDKNVFGAVSQGIGKNENFNSFRLKMVNGDNCAMECNYKGDFRTLLCSKVGNYDLYLLFGIRQNQFNKLVESGFATVKSTVIKLAIVFTVFAIFIVSTIVLSSIKSKERGRILEDKADTDLLTELSNKVATERKIQEYLEDNPNGRAMMFILDIDNFKKINDTMGHAFGDTLLKTLGKEIRTEFRTTDIVGRTGGDEFMVFLKDVNDDLIVEREANRITRFFHDFKAGGDYVKYSASASIGAAIFPDDARNFKDLYVAADQALYRAKKRGKNQLVFYNETMKK